MPKRKNQDVAKGPAAQTRSSARLAGKPESANPAPKVAKKAAPKKAKGKKANPTTENGDAKTEAPKVEAAGDAK